jgi:MoaA/NifB/PqqE/SkfB family radical SAM enzyme
MHPDLLLILREAKNRGIRCAVNTNFTLIDEGAVRQLIDIGLDGLTVSVWAGTPKTYAATHPNKDEAAFFRIRNLLRMLNALKAPGRPFVKVYHVLSNLNYREVAAMVDFAKEAQCEGVEFAVIDTIPGATDALALTRDQRREVLEQLEGIKDKVEGIVLMNMEHLLRRLRDPGADSAQYDSEFLENMPCCVGWIFSRIMPNGDVNFCLKAHRVPVGNLYKDPFRTIWNSARQIEFRHLAMTAPKSDPFFKMMGNDPDCAVGCFKSCDDLGRIVHMHNRMNRLSWAERTVLKTAAAVERLRR